MNSVLADHFRCPDQLVQLGLAGELSADAGYLQFGPNITCFGRSTQCHQSAGWAQALPDVMGDVRMSGDRVLLPFDVADVVADLRFERYCTFNERGCRQEDLLFLPANLGCRCEKAPAKFASPWLE
jgi:hypothetical protein